MEFINWIYASALGAWVRESSAGYAVVLTSHALGMAVLVGGALVYTIRVLGFPAQLPLSWLQRHILPLAWLGLVCNVISGVALFAGDATEFAVNVPFLLKLTMVVLGASCLGLLARRIREEGGEVVPMNTGTRRLAALCMLSWIGVIVAGRLIGYTVR